jgi:hypothetical protein
MDAKLLPVTKSPDHTLAEWSGCFAEFSNACGDPRLEFLLQQLVENFLDGKPFLCRIEAFRHAGKPQKRKQLGDVFHASGPRRSPATRSRTSYANWTRANSL